jgi:hypothetical protein
MLALNGFDVLGLEVCDQAVKTANNNVRSKVSNPSDDNFGGSKNRKQPGSARVILGDFFQRNWEDQAASNTSGFDLIYDYTVSCRK